MKSPLRHYRLKSELSTNKNNSFKEASRRLSTQPDTSFSNPEDSRIFRKASLNKNLFKTPVKTFMGQLAVPFKSTSQNTSHNSPSKHNFQLVSNMSKKSYDKVMAYGWSHLKFNQDSNQPVFTINLGKVKIFTIVESPHGKHVSKTLCEKYTIQIMKIVEDTDTANINECQINEAFSAVKKNADELNYQFSIISIVVNEEKVMISHFGENLNGLCFTKKNQLINLAETETKATKTSINSNFKQIKSTRYMSSFCGNSKLYSSIKPTTMPPLSSQISHKIYQCSEIVWISLYSNKILQQCDQKYLKDCINKQLVLTNKSYSLSQAAMESCKKIIHDIIRDGNQSSMAAIVVLFDQYPFEAQLKATEAKKHQTIWNKIKNCQHNSKINDNKQQKPQNGTKLLKYIGNRRSFVKNVS